MSSRKQKRLKSQVLGEYLMDQFFFRIYVDEPKPESFDQQLFQTRYQFTLLHEYIHYLHEVSTHIGTLSLVFAIGFRELLAQYVDRNHLSSDFGAEIKVLDAEKIEGIYNSLELMMGDTFNDILHDVRAIKRFWREKNYIKVPHGNGLHQNPIQVTVICVEDGKVLKELRLGKFFLYEGLAYELELIYAEKKGIFKADELDGTEYTLLRYFGEYLMPGISRYALLTLASFSLVYVDSGVMFETMVDALASEVGRTGDEAAFLARTRNKIKAEYQNLYEHLVSVLDETEIVYRNKSALASTFKDLRNIYLEAARLREQNPAFEVDLVFNGDFESLLETVPPCDYVVSFNDADPFMRDFDGTTKGKDSDGQELAKDYHAFTCHIHYCNILFRTVAAGIDEEDLSEEETCCPYFSCCDLRPRIEHPDICLRTPRKTYDLAVNSDNLYCSYGQGVLLTKGLDRKPVN